MATIRYSPSVRMGNWNEELYMQEEKIKLFSKKRDRGELLVQKTRRLFCNLLKEVPLEAPDDCVRFGSVVQLQAADLCVALAALVGAKLVDRVQQLVASCPIVASKLLQPCIRNCFRIRSAEGDDSRDGELLKYGQDFTLTTLESYKDVVLFIESEPPQVGSVKGACGFPPVVLTPLWSRYCRWKPVFWNRCERMESLGLPVMNMCKLVIALSASNNNLAVELPYQFMTYFGMESEVSVHTYKDVNKRETSENCWIFKIRNPGSSTEEKKEEKEEEKKEEN